MIGMELAKPGAALAESCLAAGLLVNCTHESVMRFAPAMNIARPILDEGLAIFEDCLAKFAPGG
jgi:acetylornithine/N-succinyldiaminopimelate aminotransferase